MPKQNKNNDVSGAVTVKPKKSTPKKTKKNTTKTPEKKKRGAPSQYANKVKPYLADIERYVRCGVTEGDICEYYGVGKTQWAQYKRDNPELTETLLHAKEQCKEDLLDNAYRVAMGYEYTEETTEEIKTLTVRLSDTKRADINAMQTRRGNVAIFVDKPLLVGICPRSASNRIAQKGVGTCGTRQNAARRLGGCIKCRSILYTRFIAVKITYLSRSLARLKAAVFAPVAAVCLI